MKVGVDYERFYFLGNKRFQIAERDRRCISLVHE